MIIHKLLPSESIIDDNHLCYPGYIYIADNIFKRYPYMGTMLIREWKAKDGIKEVRRCELFGHDNARLGDRVE